MRHNRAVHILSYVRSGDLGRVQALEDGLRQCEAVASRAVQRVETLENKCATDLAATLSAKEQLLGRS